MQKVTLIISIIVILIIGGLFARPYVMQMLGLRADMTEVETHYWDFKTEYQLNDPIPDVNIVIVKSNSLLYLLSGDELIERWPIALGQTPSGRKSSEDDGMTPVGEYFICTRETDTNNHLFMGISYPGPEDADSALADGTISDREHNDIFRSFNAGELPPQDTALGGDIGIHGGGTTGVWTNGSIGMDNNVVDILWGACPLGTPVVIYETFYDWDLSPEMPSVKT